MPDGLIQWFDPDTGEGRVLHRRRRYAVSAGDIETAARVPGARVHFDIDHDSDGTRATRVTLRRGTRSSRRQRRFGDLAGAPSAEAKKPPTTGHDELDLDPDLFRNPVRLAQRWTEQLAIGDLDEVLLLYSPTASLHTAGDVLVGVDRIRRHWQSSPLLGGPEGTAAGGEDGLVVVRWPMVLTDGATSETRLRISRGEITEQWHGATIATATDELPEQPAERALSMELSVDGEVNGQHRQRALDRIGKVLDAVDGPVLHARIRLVNATRSGRDRPAIARVMLDIDGEPIRAQAVTDDLHTAIDALEERLRQQLAHIASHREALTRRGPASPPGQWRRGDPPAQRPDHHPRPVEDRQVVRHKTFAPEDTTLDEAVFDMEAMDYDFYLFTDLASGQEAFVHRREDGGYGLQVQDGQAEDTVGGAASDVHVDREAAPQLTLQAAREYLDVGPQPWVFFTDAERGRGHVLYRRYDGHYGLITPR